MDEVTELAALRLAFRSFNMARKTTRRAVLRCAKRTERAMQEISSDTPHRLTLRNPAVIAAATKVIGRRCASCGICELIGINSPPP